MSDRNKIYIGIIASSVIVLSSLIGIIHFWTRRSHTELAIDHPQITTYDSILPDQIQYQKAKEFLKNKKILEAIQSLPNTNTLDKKNQAILRSYLAEQSLQKDTLTGRQQAREYTQQADIILQNIHDKDSNIIQQQNQAIIVATCIRENQAIPKHLTNVIYQQKELQSVLQEIEDRLDTRELPLACKTRLQENIQKNKEVVRSWIQKTQDRKRTQQEINLKLTQTVDCDINNTPWQYEIAEQADKESSKYLLAQQQILALLIQNPSDLKDKLCQDKNDSDVNNSLTQTMDALVEPQNTTTPATNNQIKYQDINGDIQTIIENTLHSNNTLIQSIQNTIYDRSYKPLQYIQNLFNQFFGNTDDFISP